MADSQLPLSPTHLVEISSSRAGSGPGFRQSTILANWLPYLLIALLCVFCHGFLLTNDGTMWDSWYVLNWLATHNWHVLHDFFGSVGMPLYGWLYRPFACASNIVAAFMVATFLCLLLQGILTYELALKLSRLSCGEALALTLLVQAMPLFTAAQDFIMFFFVFTHTLFLVGALLAVLAMTAHGRRHWAYRGIGVMALYFSLTNAALLVFYGGLYLLLYFKYQRLQGLAFVPAARRFLMRYPDFLLLPPVTWTVRMFLTPQYGWYRDYNQPGANLNRLAPNLWSFFQNVIPYHAKHTVTWMLDHPLVMLVLVSGAIVWYWRSPKQWQTERGSLPTFHFVWFGALLLLFAILPYAAAGKTFSPMPVGDPSRYCLLAGLPLAVLLFAALRAAFFWRRKASRLLPPVAGCIVIVLACQIPPVYLAERVEWIFSRALLHNAVKNEAVRDSSVVVLQGYSLSRQDVYGTYGFATAFGELTRFVTGQVPANKQFFTPLELTRILLSTTVLPNEFKRIDPAGMQTLLVAERNRGGASDWGLVFRYLAARYFGSQQDLDDFLGGLCEIKTGMLKPATPLPLSFGSLDPEPPSPDVPDGDFTNGIGMRLVRMPGGWWAGKFETTQAEFERIMGDNPSLFSDPFRPVECVSWNEAMEFCRRLTESERTVGRISANFSYRLPTVEEFGRMVADASLAEAVTATQDIRWQTAPVGVFPPNRLGLKDVVGNVWEWCLDWSDDSQRLKVSMGASWVNQAWELTPYTGPREGLGNIGQAAVNRLFGPQRMDYPDQGFWDRGFRCVLAPANTDLTPDVQ